MYQPEVRPVPVPPRLEVEIDPRRNRLTTAFRLILAIPHFFVFAFLSIAGLFVGFAGWFGALVRGRLPRFAHDFGCGLVDYSARIYAYFWLLTDRYPRFGFVTNGAPGANIEGPVRVEFAPPDTLNRAAVLFRLVLAAPVFLVSSIVSQGLNVVLVFVWIFAVFAGRVPRAAFEAVSSVVRFTARVEAYFFMLTPAYPSGLFGDPTEPLPSLAPTFASHPPPPPPPAPAAAGEDRTVVFQSLRSYRSEERARSAPPLPPAPPAVGRYWLDWHITRGAKQLLVVCIVLGFGFQALSLTFQNVPAVRDVATTLRAYGDLSDATDAYNEASSRYSRSLGLCQTVTCAQQAAEIFIGSLEAFDREVAAIDFPDRVELEVDRLRAATSAYLGQLRVVANAPNEGEYRQAAILVVPVEREFIDADNALLEAL